MNYKKLLKIAICCIVVLACILYLILPVGFGLFASIRMNEKVGQPPQGFENQTLTTSDGIPLSAWYKPPQNGSVIILLHGATASREQIRSYAEMLSAKEFGVLAFDMRGHGKSGGGGNNFNWEGTKDVGAAIKFLNSKKTAIRSIGGLGLSLGGEVLLGAASTYPELKAIVSDGATGRSTKDYLIVPGRRNLIRSWSTRLMYKSVRIFTGDAAPETLLDSISKTKNTKFLFIAAGNKSDEILYDTYFKKAAGERSKLWVVPGVGHTAAFSCFPKEYEEKVLSFFHKELM